MNESLGVQRLEKLTAETEVVLDAPFLLQVVLSDAPKCKLVICIAQFSTLRS